MIMHFFRNFGTQSPKFEDLHKKVKVKTTTIHFYITSAELPKYLTPPSTCKISAAKFSFKFMRSAAGLTGQNSLCARHKTGQEGDHLHFAYFSSFDFFVSVFISFFERLGRGVFAAAMTQMRWFTAVFRYQMKYYCFRRNLGSLLKRSCSSSFISLFSFDWLTD